MDPQVLRRRADVDPVPVVHVGDEGFPALDERREEAAFDRPRRIFRNPVERVGLEHVDAGVDRVAGDLVLARLLEEAADVAAGVGLDQPVRARIVDGREHDRRLRFALAVQPQHRSQIDIGQHVAVEDDDRLRQRIAGVPDRATSAERHRLDDVADADPEPFTFAEDLLDPARLVVQAEDHFVDGRDLLQKIDLVVEKRPIQDRHDRFRRVNRERPEARALAAGEQDGLHDNLLSYAFDRIAPRMNLPNALTVGRIFLVPLLVVVLLTKFEGKLIFGVRKELVGAAIFGIAALTDFLDGYLARRRKQITTLGQLMDPLADKLLITAALVSLVQLDLAPAWMVAVILGREFAVTILRGIAHGKGVVIAASPMGKFKMVSEVVAILALILGQEHLQQFYVIGMVALWIALVTATISGVEYYRRFMRTAV